MNYPLYHTLNRNTKNKDMSKIENEKLKKKLESLKDDSKKAILLLIVEHARVVDKFPIDIENPKLPYGMKQKRENLEINMDKLPQNLKWILWKFAKL
jgi:hypothetical protein